MASYTLENLALLALLVISRTCSLVSARFVVNWFGPQLPGLHMAAIAALSML